VFAVAIRVAVRGEPHGVHRGRAARILLRQLRRLHGAAHGRRL